MLKSYGCYPKLLVRPSVGLPVALHMIDLRLTQTCELPKDIAVAAGRLAQFIEPIVGSLWARWWAWVSQLSEQLFFANTVIFSLSKLCFS